MAHCIATEECRPDFKLRGTSAHQLPKLLGQCFWLPTFLHTLPNSGQRGTSLNNSADFNKVSFAKETRNIDVSETGNGSCIQPSNIQCYEQNTKSATAQKHSWICPRMVFKCMQPHPHILLLRILLKYYFIYYLYMNTILLKCYAVIFDSHGLRTSLWNVRVTNRIFSFTFQ